MFSLPLTPVKPQVLAVRLIPAPHADLHTVVQKKKSEFASYGLVSCDFEPSLFVALDEATKASPVTVIMAKKILAGIARATDPLTGEAFGILAGADDEVVREGLKSVIRTLESTPYYLTGQGRSIAFFPHVISSTGEFLSKEAGVNAGEPLAYLMAPPIESIVALDAALKAAQVKLLKHFEPPTETNRGGGFLTGELQECEAAAFAFAQTVLSVANDPIQAMDRVTFARRPLGKSE